MKTFRTGRMAACVAAAVMAFFCVTDVMADAYESDGIKYFLYDDTHTATVIGCDRSLASIVIPTEVTGYPVTAIGFRAFKGYTSLTSVNIPNSVTIIDEEAFSYCTSLISVNIPNSIYTITNSAFQNCAKLESIEISPNTVYIGNHAFYGCRSLKGLSLPEQTRSIGRGAFYLCTALDSLKLGENITTIQDSTFYGCISLKSLSIPDNVRSIGRMAFFGCKYVTSLFIGKEVAKIDDSAFYNCVNLRILNLPKRLMYVGEKAFYNCLALDTLVIKSDLLTIADEAFGRGDNISEIRIYGEKTIPIIYNLYSPPFSQTVYQNAKLYVPSVLERRYKSDEVWGPFLDILPLGIGNVTKVPIDELVKFGNNEIIFTRDNIPYMLYDTTGNILKSGLSKKGGNTYIPSGVVILSIGNTSYKIYSH